MFFYQQSYNHIVSPIPLSWHPNFIISSYEQRQRIYKHGSFFKMFQENTLSRRYQIMSRFIMKNYLNKSFLRHPVLPGKSGPSMSWHGESCLVAHLILIWYLEQSSFRIHTSCSGFPIVAEALSRWQDNFCCEFYWIRQIANEKEKRDLFNVPLGNVDFLLLEQKK